MLRIMCWFLTVENLFYTFEHEVSSILSLFIKISNFGRHLRISNGAQYPKSKLVNEMMKDLGHRNVWVQSNRRHSGLAVKCIDREKLKQESKETLMI